MQCNTIALGLMSADEAQWLVPVACAAAAQSGAHLIGIRAIEPFVPYMGFEGSAAMYAAPMFHDWQVEETREIRSRFEQCTGQEDFASEWREQEVGQLGAETFLINNTRSADLVMMGQIDRKADRHDHVRMQEQVIRQSGRPVLIIPPIQKKAGLGHRILIGWSNTREATRAAHDALSLAEPGAQIDILFVSASGEADMPAAGFRRSLAATCARHGFGTSIIERTPAAGNAGQTLLQVAADTGADMIVLGAFGHSRVYDFVIGAVTRELLDTANVPVLYSR
jgi:nucleotide-binding universal stress UspA family protein